MSLADAAVGSVFFLPLSKTCFSTGVLTEKDKTYVERHKVKETRAELLEEQLVLFAPPTKRQITSAKAHQKGFAKWEQERNAFKKSQVPRCMIEPTLYASRRR